MTRRTRRLEETLDAPRGEASTRLAQACLLVQRLDLLSTITLTRSLFLFVVEMLALSHRCRWISSTLSPNEGIFEIETVSWSKPTDAND